MRPLVSMFFFFCVFFLAIVLCFFFVCVVLCLLFKTWFAFFCLIFFCFFCRVCVCFGFCLAFVNCDCVLSCCLVCVF